MNGKLPVLSLHIRDITQRKKAENMLKNSEEHYRLLFENNPLPMWVYDQATLAFLAVNDAAVKKYGYSHEEFLKLTIADIRPAEDVSLLMELMQKERPALRSTSGWRHCLKDGTIIDVEITSHMIDWNEERHILVVAQDVTQRIQNEQEARTARDLFTKLFHLSPIPSVLIRMRDFAFADANPSFERTTGLCREEILGQRLSDFNLLVDDTLPGQYLPLFNEQKQLGDLEFELITRTGEKRQVIGYFEILEQENEDFVLAKIIDVTDRKKAEQALFEGEVRFRSLIENAPDGITLLGPDGRLQYISPSTERILGYTSEEIIGHNPAEYTHPDDLPALLAILDDLIQNNGQTVTTQYRFRHKNGSWCWIESTISNLLSKPSVNAIVFNYRDITERKQAEELLRESEDLFRTSFESSPAGICLVSLEDKFLKPNQKLCEILGYSQDELLQLQFNDVTHPEDRSIGVSFIKKILSGEMKQASFEKRCIHKNQNILFVKISTTIVRNQTGEPLYFVTYLQDFTEQKRAEDAIRTSEAKFRSYIEYAPLAVFVVDHAGNYLEFNRAAEDLLGYDADTLITLNIANIVLEEDREQALESFTTMLQQGYSVGEFHLKKQDGSPVWVSVRSVRLSDDRAIGFCQDITERNQAVAQMRYEAELLAAIKDAVIATDVDFNITSWNPGAESIYGWKAAEVIGRSLTDVLQTEFHDSTRESALLTAINGDEYRGEIKQRRKDGLMIPIESTVRALRDGSGQITGLVSVNRDITQRMKSQDELQSQNELMQNIFDHIPVMISLIDQNGNLQLVNREWENTLGWTFNEIQEQKPDIVAELYPDPQQREEILQAIANPTPNWKNYKTRVRNGRILDTSWTAIKLSNGMNLGIGQDITLQVQAKQELLQYRDHLEELVKERTGRLAESEANLRKFADEISDLYNNAPCGYHSLDINGVFMRINDTELKWLGYTCEEMIGKMRITDLMLPDGVALLNNSLAEFMRKGFINNLEVELIRKDGSIFQALVNATVVYDAEGNFRMIRATINDNSAHKEAEKIMRESKETAESANRAKSAFLANMSHEIRTPMNAVLGFTQLMLRDATLTPTQKNHLETINRSGDHLLDLINEILEMSKIEANRITLAPTSFDLHALIVDLQVMFQQRTDAKNLEFRVEVSKQMPQYILADKNKLTEIFVNLLGNAVKFTQHGMICWRINASQMEDGKLRLIAEVEDTGPGIAQQEIEFLFKPFGQTSSGARVGGGTGLGLAISSKIAQLMGGDITVSSQEGKGSTFTMNIIVEPGSATEQEQAPSKRRVIRLKEGQNPFRILVVDDQPENRLLLVELLKEVGFITHEAVNGAEAIHFFEQWHPHLIFMDIRMPVMDGYEATRHIKAADAQIPVIAVTASAFTDEKQKVFDAGADAYLRKPLNEHELFQTIQAKLNIEYLYGDEIPGPISKYPVVESTLSPELFVSLPDALIAEIRQATLAANLNQLLAIIAQIAPQNPQLAAKLQQLARNYQYEKLLEILQSRKPIDA